MNKNNKVLKVLNERLEKIEKEIETTQNNLRLTQKKYDSLVQDKVDIIESVEFLNQKFSKEKDKEQL